MYIGRYVRTYVLNRGWITHTLKKVTENESDEADRGPNEGFQKGMKMRGSKKVTSHKLQIVWQVCDNT